MSKNLIKLMCGLCVFFLFEGGIVYYLKVSDNSSIGAGILQWLLTIILLVVLSIAVPATQKTKYNWMPITLATGMSAFLYFSWLPDIIHDAHTLMGVINLLIFIGILFLQIFYAIKNSVLGSFLTFILLAAFLLLYTSFFD